LVPSRSDLDYCHDQKVILKLLESEKDSTANASFIKKTGGINVRNQQSHNRRNVTEHGRKVLKKKSKEMVRR